MIRTETEAIGLFVGRRRPTAEEADGLADVFSKKAEICFDIVFALRFGLQIESLSSYRQKHQTARSERLPCLCDGKHDQGCYECCENLQRFFMRMCENRIRDDPNVRMTHAWGNCTRLR